MQQKLAYAHITSYTLLILQANPATKIPAVLNNVIEKTCTFDFKISSYNTNLGYEEFTFVKLSEYNPTVVEPVTKTSKVLADEQNIV